MKQCERVVSPSITFFAGFSIAMGLLSNFVAGSAHDYLFGVSLVAALYTGESIILRTLHRKRVEPKSERHVPAEDFTVNDAQSLV